MSSHRAMIAALLLVVQHAGFLVLLFAMAAATGTAVIGPRAPMALRSILGLAVAGQVLVVLGTFGAIRPWVIGALAAVALIVGMARMEWSIPRWPLLAALTATTLPLFALALCPPIAFDETLYHLPFVEAIAQSGSIQFLPALRFPIFPELHEALCVPGFLALGDLAPHLVAVAELILLVALLVAWLPGRAGLVAAALLLGNPLVIHLASITHADTALMLFVAAAFFCLDRATAENETWFIALAGFLLGTASSVKYLGAFFALAAFAWIAVTGPNRWRRAIVFAVAGVVAAAPTYALILGFTGNLVFPFMRPSPWMLATTDLADPLIRALRLLRDMTFSGERVDQQPPISPFIALSMLITIVAARRDRRAAFLCALFGSYIALFIFFMPFDRRYLMPLLPLAIIAAAPWISRWRALALVLSVLSLGAGLAYAGYRLRLLGPIPTNVAQRRQFLEKRIPEYRALERRGPGKTYVCAAEHLQYYGRGELIGDWNGTLAYDKVFSGHDPEELFRTLVKQDVRLLLVSHRCPPRWRRLAAPPFFTVVYADSGAVLWRVESIVYRVDR